jgi:hypothetical protein
MARLKNGPFGALIGKLGNLVGYVRLGQSLIRMKPHTKRKRSKKRTPAQKASSEAFTIVSKFVTPINSFVNIGFKLDIKGTAMVARNAAMSYNSAAVNGEYPNQQFDYTKAVVTAGKLLGPENPQVVLNEYNPVAVKCSLKFSWAVNPDWNYIRQRDQVMMLAFFPETGTANWCLSGARRSEGSDVLAIFPDFIDRVNTIKQTYVETYMAFIADDRESISGSIYTGRVNLTSGL